MKFTKKNWFYRGCSHRSHRMHLPCFRRFNWQHLCLKHTRKCFMQISCPAEKASYDKRQEWKAAK